ncbi:MAG: class I SAM-dependent methyltransferase [Thermoleophilia bacterium]
MSIEAQLDIRFPIHWKGFIDQDFASFLVHKVVANRPVRIVELGSGLTSLLVLKTLKKLGYEGSLHSYDSDAMFLKETENRLLAEGVLDTATVSLRHSPLREVTLNGASYRWYDPDDFVFPFERIDLLLVDGPYGPTCKNARYPAVPVMRKYLKPGSVVILHDTNRPDEAEIVELWQRENPDIAAVYKIDYERGAAELRF